MSRLTLLSIFVTVVAALAIACRGDSNDATSAGAEISGGDRVTISLALHDSIGQHAALYAIEKSIVTSDTIDVVPNYLPVADLDEAVQSRQFDVIEASVLTVPVGKTEGLDLVVLSAGLQDVEGTFLYASADGPINSVRSLQDGTLGAVALGDPSVLETRFLLHQSYDLQAGVLESDRKTGAPTINVAPVESQAALLQSGEIDAVIATQQGAYQLSLATNVRLLTGVTAGIRELHDAPIANSLLVTYPDVAARKADALAELNRLLAESVAYFKANRNTVIAAIATQGAVDPAYIDWWWQHYDLPLGDLSPATQEQILFVWEAARALGDIESYPELAAVLFDQATAGTATPPA
ncbi:MAG: hypothetical protein WBD55_13675 [Dehalococcoidia bacterium]